MKLTYNLNQLKEVAETIIKSSQSKTLLFYGEMGVGKTTLIKELVYQLGVTDTTSSPTFSLINEYQGTNDTVYHFDFYRINEEEEVLDIGIEDYFYSDAWCLIEWPNKIENLLPEDSVKLHIIEKENGEREITMR